MDDLRQEIVTAAVAEVEKRGLGSVVEQKAKEVLGFMGSFEIDVPTAVVVLDYALFAVCTWIVDQGFIEVKSEDAD